MNSTQWATLTEFVKYLGRTGKCKVDETEKGWFVTYIDWEPETLMREKLKNKLERAEVADEEWHERAIEQQIGRAAKNTRPMPPPAEDSNTEEKKMLQRSGEEGKVACAIMPSRAKPAKEGKEANLNGGVRAGQAVSYVFSGGKSSKESGDALDSGPDHLKSAYAHRESGKSGVAALVQPMEEEEKAKDKANRKDYWLVEGLIVKVMSKSLAEQGFYKQKGVVRKVIGKYVAEVKILESGDVLKVDQEELETVIPQIGGLVKIVNGASRGSTARLISIDTAKFTAKVQVEKGMYDGRVLNAVEYEDLCKISTSS